MALIVNVQHYAQGWVAQSLVKLEENFEFKFATVW